MIRYIEEDKMSKFGSEETEEEEEDEEKEGSKRRRQKMIGMQWNGRKRPPT